MVISEPNGGLSDDWPSAFDVVQVHQQLREIGRIRRFSRNDRLMVYGDRSDEVLLIESGNVKVVLSTDGGTELIAGFYGAGELIGELGVMNGIPRTASVIAHTSGSAVHVSGKLFLGFVSENRLALLHIVGTLQRRLRNADRYRLDNASQDVPTRVARQLLAWGQSCGRVTAEGTVVRGLTQKDLAQTVSASVKTVESALKVLRGAGLLHTRRCTFVLPNPGRLERSLTDSGWRLAGR